MKRTHRILCAVALLLALPWVSPSRLAAVELEQADSENLLLEQPARRLVTLSPHLAELVYAAGAGPQLVATVAYSEYPKEAANLPRVGDAFRLDIEAIFAVRPDLVVAWGSGNPRAAVEQMRNLGLRVWPVEIRQPHEIADTLRAIGLAAGTARHADAAARDFEAGLTALSMRYRGVEPLEYFYQVDDDPLFTINGRHLISQGLALCGGVNIFEAEPGLAFQVAHESVIVANPEAIFAPRSPAQPDPLQRWRDWPSLDAVAAGALFTLDADRISRATPRWLDSIETACTLLHQLRATDR
ncbi:MAG: cobalamin-binding protein [Gammaproteobacteria bacterium]|nr:cobalamin-binding protein [Gammaproteobacteria bacterium]